MKNLSVRVAVVIGCLLGLVLPQPTGKSDGLDPGSVQAGRFRSWSGLESTFYSQSLVDTGSGLDQMYRLTPDGIVDQISYDLSVINGPVIESPPESALVKDQKMIPIEVASSTQATSTAANQTSVSITTKTNLPRQSSTIINNQLMGTDQKKVADDHQQVDTNYQPVAKTNINPQLKKPTPKPKPTKKSSKADKKDSTVAKPKDNQDPNNLCRLAYNYDNWSADIAYAVCMAESRGKATATNSRDRHRGCVGSHGLFQIACIHAPKTEMYDPAKNVAMANKIYLRKNSFKPWGAYTNGSYRKYLPR